MSASDDDWRPAAAPGMRDLRDVPRGRADSDIPGAGRPSAGSENPETGHLLTPASPTSVWDESRQHAASQAAVTSARALEAVTTVVKKMGLDSDMETLRSGTRPSESQWLRAAGRVTCAILVPMAALFLLLLTFGWSGTEGHRADAKMAPVASVSTKRPGTLDTMPTAAPLTTAAPITAAPTTAAPAAAVVHTVVHTQRPSPAPVLPVLRGSGPKVKLVQTWEGGGRLQAMPEVHLEDDFDFDGPEISVDLGARQQEITGFGGAFTEAAAVTLMKLPSSAQEDILERYFGPSGIGYTLGRVHINSCDFSLGNYNFDDAPNDFNLVHFDHTVAHDTEALIPMLQRASAKVAERGGARLRILATPWSPPAWMKTSNQMNGSPQVCLKNEVHGTWANYISNWITAYKQHNIDIWALTVQNEPQVRPGWEACVFSPQEEGAFLGDHLGPTLQAQHPEVDIYIYDDSKHNLVGYSQAVMANAKARPFVKGMAFHWYTGDHFDAVAAVRQSFPEVKLLASEATYEKRRWRDLAKPLDDFRFGVGYAHDIIGDLNAGTSGWLDWNLLLDTTGGPNHVGNSCDAAVIVDVEAQAVRVHPQYYFIGHFSKFMPPGSVVLKVNISGSQQYTGGPRDYGVCDGQDGIEATAAVRPDNKVAIVVLNCGDDAKVFKLRTGAKSIRGNIPAKGIQTYVMTQEQATALIHA